MPGRIRPQPRLVVDDLERLLRAAKAVRERIALMAYAHFCTYNGAGTTSTAAPNFGSRLHVSHPPAFFGAEALAPSPAHWLGP
jgi:hypothetical protein